MNYNELKSEIQKAPQTHLPALLATVIEACHENKVFVREGGLERFMQAVLDRPYKDLLKGLIALTDYEGKNGGWRVTLDYDNYQDVARVLDADGNVLGACGDIEEMEPDIQFERAIREAMTKKLTEELGRPAEPQASSNQPASPAPPGEGTRPTNAASAPWRSLTDAEMDTLRLDWLGDPKNRFGYSIQANGYVNVTHPFLAIEAGLRKAIDHARCYSGQIPICLGCKRPLTEQQRGPDGRFSCPTCCTSFCWKGEVAK
jgi:hypothetical protein